MKVTETQLRTLIGDSKKTAAEFNGELTRQEEAAKRILENFMKTARRK